MRWVPAAAGFESGRFCARVADRAVPILTCLIRTTLALTLLLVVGVRAHADDTAAWAALRQGGVVALMRHGDAPGVGDPPAVLLVVTHGENIRALTGQSPAPAAIVVVAPANDGTLREIGTIAPR